MGAAPSRETIEHSLPQAPFYGQRQQIVLIPLLKKFFPSADCPLFVQLYEARCDPAVRYYYYANDGMSEAPAAPTSPKTPSAYAATDSLGNVASPLYLAEVVGSTPVHCPPADVFPAVPFTREAMYDAYITNGGERIVYDTDAAMLRAYRDDPTAVRPLPCAVAFLYHKSASSATATATDEGGVAHAATDECAEVLGCHVKATGFVGDVHGLGGTDARQLPDFEMQMFLTKSAGDHNRTHVLLTAVYTYAEQWQRACLHCVPCDLTATELMPAPRPPRDAADDEEEAEDIGDVFFYYKPFSQSHDMLVEASRNAGHHHHHHHSHRHQTKAAGAATAEGDLHESGTFELEEKARFWAPPPLLSLFMRSRRANVPLLCFLREVRACVRSFFLFHFKYYLEHQDLEAEVTETKETGAATTRKPGPITRIDHGAGEKHPYNLPPLGSSQMWLQEAAYASTSTSAAEGDTETESILNFHLIALYVRGLAEFIVACLLHNINPLDVFRIPSEADDPTAAAPAAEEEVTAAPDALGTAAAPPDAVRGSTPHCTSTFSTAAGAAANFPTVPHSVSLIRLPDEDMLVQPWPPSEPAGGPAASCSPTASPAAATVLSRWRSRHTDHHLFWLVGPNVANRRSATAALLHWYREEKAPVVWGYTLDAKDREVAVGDETAACNVSAQIFPSSSLENYMSTLTVRGHTEELLRGSTVLCLMPVSTATGDPPTSRVLRVCRLPLEELLLGELRNASKLAREAGPEDGHWVRQTQSSSDAAAMHRGCVLRASAATVAAAEAAACNGVELPVVPVEADGVVGDGTSCLWRVNLIERVSRIIAVTPQFLKPFRKKHPKKKKMPAKTAVVHGTAADVFLPSAASPATTPQPATSPAATTPAPPQDAEEPRQSPPGQESAVIATEAPPPESVMKEAPGAAPCEPAATAAAVADVPLAATPVKLAASKKAKKSSDTTAAVSAVPSTAATTTAAAADTTRMTSAEKKKRKGEPPASATSRVAAVSATTDVTPASLDTAATTPAPAPTSVADAAAAAMPPTTGPSSPRPLLPPVPAGEYDPRRGSDDGSGACDRHTTPTPTMRAHGESTGVLTAHAPPHVFAYHHHAAPPAYGAYAPPPRGPYECYDYSYRPPYPAAAPPLYSGPNGGAVAGWAPPSYDSSVVYHYYGGAGGYDGGRVGGTGVPAAGYAHHSAALGQDEGYAEPPQDGVVGRTAPLVAALSPPLLQSPPSAEAVTSGCEREELPPFEVPHSPPDNTIADCDPTCLPETIAVEDAAGAQGESTSSPSSLAARSRHGPTSSSLHRHVSFGADVDVAGEAAISAVRLSSPTGRMAAHRYGSACATAVSPTAHRSGQPPHHPGHAAAPTQPLQRSDIYSPCTSHAFEDNDVASPSGAGSHSPYQLEEAQLPLTNESSTLMASVPHGQRSLYAGSPYQASGAAVDNVGVACGSGDGPAGGAVHVTVRVRHHHHHHPHTVHSRTASCCFSDATTDPASLHHHHHQDMTGQHMNGSASVASGGGLGAAPQMSQSFASMESTSIIFQGPIGAAGSSSFRDPGGVNGVGDHHHSHPHHHSATASRELHHSHRHHTHGATASSTRSGDTTSTARLTDKRTGTYRWDWRTAVLDMGDED